MVCRNCGNQNPEDSIYCESCGKSLHRKAGTKVNPNKMLKTVSILSVTAIACAAIVWIAVRLFSPDIVLTGGGEYDVYKDYIDNIGESDHILLNEPGADDEVEIPLSDIAGNWYVLLRTYENGSDDFSTETEYIAVLEAKDAFNVKFTCTLYDGYMADGSEFKPRKWSLRPADGSFYRNILALYFPGRGLELVFIPNRLMYGEPGRFIEVSYDEKSLFGKTTVYQMIIVKLP